ncbi:MAG TPA: FmdB family transcriptional regulator [Cyanobacteria bacterium UBA9971]|nr:FmdB family transcriptional regulator [Cyanobacteria bacterium UBA9971]
MASYDYTCKDCAQVFTIEKSMTDSSKPACVYCNSSNVARIWGNVQLKGCGSKGSSSGCGSSCSKSSCSGCNCG